MTTPLSSVCVLGLGAVGTALAIRLAEAGHQVTGLEADGPAAARASRRLDAVITDEAVRHRITCGTDAGAADFVIEALPEVLADKVTALSAVARRCGPGTVFVTTTSGFSVTGVAAAIGRLTSTVGVHVTVVDALPGGVELITTPVTDAPVIARADALLRSLGTKPVVAADLPGFLGGGLLLHYLNNAARMYEQGYASRDDLDTAMVLGCGLPLGPLAHLDALGIDNVTRSLAALAERTGDPTFAPADVLTGMVKADLLGRKTGRGFYVHSPGSAQAAPPPPVTAARPRHVAVIGSGTMATGVTTVLVQAGYPTTLLARTEIRAKDAAASVEKALDRRVRAGKLSAAGLTAAVDLLTTTTDPGALRDCDLALECVAEDLAVKQAVLSGVDAVLRPDAVLATVTSSLSVSECASAVSRPEQVVGLHFFNPAPAMKLVEVVTTPFGSASAAATATAFVRSLGKEPVRCGDRTGFIVNALLFPYLNRAVRLLEQHRATPDELDDVMTTGHGYPLGPIALLDRIGLDVSLAIQRRLHAASGEPTLLPSHPLAALAEAGHLGVKAARGFRPTVARAARER